MIAESVVAALQDAFWMRAEDVLFHHTNPWELDEALTDWGYGTGPCEAQDHFGLERVRARQPLRPTPVLTRMITEGRMGKISGVGFYRYPGGGGAVIDPLIEDLIREEAWFSRIERVARDDNALVTLMNAALKDVVNPLLDKGMSRDDLVTQLVQAVHFPSDGLAFL
ncbi:MAG: 3-hydroxyacyl-CoA dehydrogenase family protein [Sulfitobacter sp.]